MNETGKIIQELRQKAGFSQKTLAKALHITDKAISKWERGICLPDVTLLPKLSLLLDADIEQFISKSIESSEWAGLIDISECDLSQTVYDKPLVYYLISHYLLLGITKIYVQTDEKNISHLSQDRYKNLGVDFAFGIPAAQHLMIMNHPWFIFGSDLTQQFQGAMLSGRNMKLVPENQEPMVYFSLDGSHMTDKKKFMRNASRRTLGRGMVCLDMSNADKILEVAAFVKTYQRNSGLLIGSLEEIAFRKGLISEKQLEEIAKEVPYGEYLGGLMGKPQVG